MANLGDTLRAARISRKLTLDDAEQACRVRRNFLEALEDERYDLLPPRAYAQGLLTVYARYLGLDPYPLIRLLPPEPEAEPEVLAPPPPPPQAPWRVGVIIGLVLLAAAGGYAYVQGMVAGPPSQPRDDPLIITVPTVAASPSAVPPPSPAASPPPAATPSPVATATPSPTATAVVLVSLPTLTGQQLSAAMGALQSMGLTGVVEQRTSAQVPAGTVMEQQPSSGSRIPQGDTVLLVVSRGPPPVTVPNVVGRPEAEGRAALVAAGVRPGQFTNYQGRAQLTPAELGRVCVGCVLSTTPASGTEVPPGTEVLIAVRRE
jgi:hypothetical protein